MIKDFSAHPKPQNNNSKKVMWLFFILGAVAAVISVAISSWRGVVGLAALALISTGILMYTKYVSVAFYYDILAEDMDTPIFVVRQRVGKRDVTLCRVELADIVSVKRESAAERKAHEREAGTSYYVYAPTLNPPVSYRMRVVNPRERADLILEGTDEFFEKIIELANEARALRQEDEE